VSALVFLQDVLVDWISERIGKDIRKMATQADVDNAINGLKTEVAADFQAVQDLVAKLQEQIASGTGTALDAVVAEINQTTADLHAKYAPPAS